MGSSYCSAIASSAPRIAASRVAAPGFFAGHSRDCGGPSLGTCIAGRALSGICATTSSASSQLASARLAWRREKAGIFRSVAGSGCLWAASSVIATSGRILLGARSSRCAIGITGVPELGDVRQAATGVDVMDARGAAPRVAPRFGADANVRNECRELLLRPWPLAGFDEPGGELVA